MSEYLNLKHYLGLPVLASEHGQNVDDLIVYVHWLMLVLFAGWLAYFVYALVRFRKGRHPKADYVGVKSHLSSYVEVAVALVEGILLLGFAVPFWAKAVDQWPDEKNATVIQVVAEQFGWNARYAGKDGVFGRQDQKFVAPDNKLGVDKADPAGKDDIQTLNEIHVPINKPVIIKLTSRDVIHSLKILSLRVTQDAIPGMMIPLHFTPTKPGIYQINCAQLCGNGHSAMAAGRLYVDDEAAYNKWLEGAGSKATSFE